MYEDTDIEMELKNTAEEISKKYDGAPVVVIIGGYKTDKVDIKACQIGSSLHNKQDRMRDILGILQTSIQLLSFKHLFPKYFAAYFNAYHNKPVQPDQKFSAENENDLKTETTGSLAALDLANDKCEEDK